MSASAVRQTDDRVQQTLVMELLLAFALELDLERLTCTDDLSERLGVHTHQCGGF